MCTKYAYNVDFDVEAGIWRAYAKLKTEVVIKDIEEDEEYDLI